MRGIRKHQENPKRSNESKVSRNGAKSRENHKTLWGRKMKTAREIWLPSLSRENWKKQQGGKKRKAGKGD